MSDLREKLNFLAANAGQKRKIEEDEYISSVKRPRNESESSLLRPPSHFHNHNHNYKSYFDQKNMLSGRKCFEFFSGRESPFSQQHPAEFTIDDKQFTSTEQYLVYCKAVLFKNKEIEEQIMNTDNPEEHKHLGEKMKDIEFDFFLHPVVFKNKEIEEQIMNTDNPEEHKHLGEKIKDIDFETWMQHSIDVIKQGNMAKFSQNSKLKDQLFATSPRLMVEADPSDSTWGIGLHQEDPQAWDMRSWRGENILGFTITEVREELMRLEAQQGEKEGEESIEEGGVKKKKKVGIGRISHKDSLLSRLKKMKNEKESDSEKGRKMSASGQDSAMESEERTQQEQKHTKTGGMGLDRRDSDHEKLDSDHSHRTDRSSDRRSASERDRTEDSCSRRRDNDSHWRDMSLNSRRREGERRDGMRRENERYRRESTGFFRSHFPDNFSSRVQRRRSESCMPRVTSQFSNHNHMYKRYFEEENLISGRENFELFFGWQSPFSQHHPAKFVIDRKEFNCAEQWYMYNKAVLFEDKEIEDQIMRSSDPKEQKRLGRTLKNFNLQTWMQHSVDVVRRGNMAKFSQNLHLKEQLFATFPRLMVEASPQDSTWGIALRQDDPLAWDMRTWRGENILGFTITEVREELMRQEPDWEKRLEEWKEKKQSERRTSQVSSGERLPSENWDRDLIKVDRYNSSTRGRDRLRSSDGWDAASYSRRWDSEKYGGHRRSSERRWGSRDRRDDQWRRDRERSFSFVTPSKHPRRFSMPSQVYSKIVNHDHIYKHYFEEENLVDGRENFEFFFGWQSPFSQHHLAKFVIDRKEFNCAEQWYMYNKAVLFKDKEIEEQIMRSSDPKAQKRLGRQIENFDFQTWMLRSVDVVRRGNMAKFSQNDHLKMQLFATAPKLLVEASPGDCTWGIGLAGYNPDAWDMRTWRGENILGFTITEVRDELMRQERLGEEKGKKDKLSSVCGKEKRNRHDSEQDSESSDQDIKDSDRESKVRDSDSKKIQKKRSVSHQKKSRNRRRDSMKCMDEKIRRHDRSSSGNIKRRGRDHKRHERHRKEHTSKSLDSSDSSSDSEGTSDHKRKDSKTHRVKEKRSSKKYESSSSSSSSDSEKSPKAKRKLHHKKKDSERGKKLQRRNERDENSSSSSSRDSEDTDSPNDKRSHCKKKNSARCRKEQRRNRRHESRSNSSSDSEDNIIDKERSHQQKIAQNTSTCSNSGDSEEGGKTKQDRNINILGNNQSDTEGESQTTKLKRVFADTQEDHNTRNQGEPSIENRRESKSTDQERYKREKENGTSESDHDEDEHERKNNRGEKNRQKISDNEEVFDVDNSGLERKKQSKRDTDVVEQCSNWREGDNGKHLKQISDQEEAEASDQIGLNRSLGRTGSNTGSESGEMRNSLCDTDEGAIPFSEQDARRSAEYKEESISDDDICKQDTQEQICKDEQEEKQMVKVSESFREQGNKTLSDVEKDEFETEGTFKKKEKEFMEKINKRNYRGSKSCTKDSESEPTEPNKHKRDRDSESDCRKHDRKASRKDSSERNESSYRRDSLHRTDNRYKTDSGGENYSKYRSDSVDRRESVERFSRSRKDSVHRKDGVDRHESRFGTGRSTRRDSYGKEGRRHSVENVHIRDSVDAHQSRNRKDSVSKGDRKYSVESIQRKNREDTHQSRSRKDSARRRSYSEESRHRTHSADRHQRRSRKDSIERKDNVDKRNRNCKNSAGIKDTSDRRDSTNIKVNVDRNNSGDPHDNVTVISESRNKSPDVKDSEVRKDRKKTDMAEEDDDVFVSDSDSGSKKRNRQTSLGEPADDDCSEKNFRKKRKTSRDKSKEKKKNGKTKDKDKKKKSKKRDESWSSRSENRDMKDTESMEIGGVDVEENLQSEDSKVDVSRNLKKKEKADKKKKKSKKRDKSLSSRSEKRGRKGSEPMEIGEVDAEEKVSSESEDSKVDVSRSLKDKKKVDSDSGRERQKIRIEINSNFCLKSVPKGDGQSKDPQWSADCKVNVIYDSGH